MTNMVDENIGLKVNRLTVVKFSHTKEYCYGHIRRVNYYLCSCECGGENTIDINSVKSGYTKSCGCLQREATSLARKTHGAMHSRIYRIYSDIKTRCLNKKSTSYHHYGGRGIKISDSWLESFENFRDDMLESYNKHVEEFGIKDTTIERIDVDKGYYKENCKWATMKEQGGNRRNNRYFEATTPDKIKYISKNQREFSRQHGLQYKNINACLKNKKKTHYSWTFRYLTEEEIAIYLQEQEVNK